MRGLFLLCVILGFIYKINAQSKVTGIVTDNRQVPIADVSVIIKNTEKGAVTNFKGEFELDVNNNNVILLFHHISYHPFEIEIKLSEFEKSLSIVLEKRSQMLNSVDITGVLEKNREQAGVTTLEPKSIEVLPSPFNDFTKVLSTLPGVVSNNELSSTYSVRGGNFDENLVYVNDIPVYRPQLVSAGRQEGLSFINSKLVSNISFSAGGWQSKYGDKLSSSLNVEYKQPNELSGSVTASLLGADVHFENSSENDRINYIFGVRHKRSEYLLNSLETKGEYRPRFTDVQSYINFNLGSKTNISKTKLGLLFGYSRNRYQVIPQGKETEFGTFNQSMRLYVALIGNEYLQYDTYQGGIKFSHVWNSKVTSHLIVSGVNSAEKEYRDVEGAYRLCDVDNRPGSNSFNECVVTRGIGSNYQHSRNKLDLKILNIESRNEIKLNDNNQLEFGVGYGLQLVDDALEEYTFRDSTDFIIDLNNLNEQNVIRFESMTAYVQNTTNFSSKLWLTEGVRFYYTDRNEKLLISPRIQIGFEPDGIKKDVVLRAGVGVYQQPAFYREMRDMSGQLHQQIDAQISIHYILGIDQNMLLWDRGFKLTAEGYYKDYINIVPYDVDNVRIRYYADTKATGYATGLDVRFSGEFIPGTVSWFSLGVLSTKENVKGDNKAMIRRPSDQRLNLGVYFQDQLPNDPSWRVNLSFLVGTGLPFGPPGEANNRNIYNGDIYRRVDVGFIKELYFGNNNKNSLLISAEVLNMLGTDNTISYTWVEDVIGQEYAVPNSLSARFLNLKFTVKI
ncbi:MAG: TonB-dependent receptor [Cyclobacteriaceae bacterium]|nr:TonB-dependent receptor [Cyclobacteriaceae bacterium]